MRVRTTAATAMLAAAVSFFGFVPAGQSADPLPETAPAPVPSVDIKLDDVDLREVSCAMPCR